MSRIALSRDPAPHAATMTPTEAPTAPTLNVLSFRLVFVDVDPDLGDGAIATLRPMIDGVDVLDADPWVMGRDPDALLHADAPDLLPPGEGWELAIGVCTCGELGCGAFRVTVSRDGDVVRWSPSRGSHTVPETYVFGLVAYLDELEAARALRLREGRGRRIAHGIYRRLGARYGVNRPLLDGPTRIYWVNSWPWTSDTVKARIEPHRDQQDLVEFAPLPAETDDEAAVRIADLLWDLSSTHPDDA